HRLEFFGFKASYKKESKTIRIREGILVNIKCPVFIYLAQCSNCSRAAAEVILVHCGSNSISKSTCRVGTLVLYKSFLLFHQGLECGIILARIGKVQVQHLEGGLHIFRRETAVKPFR